MSLTQLQENFVNAYLGDADYNGTEAVMLAGYDVKDRNTAAVIASENLRKPKIRDIIRARLRENAMTADEALMRLGRQARADVGTIVYIRNGQLRVRDWEALREAGLTHLVKEIRETQYGLVVKMYSTQKALELILKEHGAFDHDAAGTEEDPQHVVQHTREEWLAEQERRRQQADDARATLTDTDE